MRKRLLLSCLALCFLVLAMTSSAVAKTSTSTGSEKWYWQNPLPQGNMLEKVQFINENKGWAIGARGTLLETADGGQTWTSRATAETIANVRTLTALCFVSETLGYLGTSDGIIMKLDAGSWISTTVNPSGAAITDIAMSGGVLWATTADGALYRKEATWIRKYQFPGKTLQSLALADATHGWAVGGSGFIVKLHTDPVLGQVVTSFTVPGTADLNDVACLPGNLNNVWACGDLGTILRSQDGGGGIAQWAPRTFGTNDLWSVTFSSDASSTVRRGWFVGSQGTIAVATDSDTDGIVVTAIDSRTTRDLYAVASLGAARAWAVGSDGAIVVSDASNPSGPWTPSFSDILVSREHLRHVDFAPGTEIGSLEGYAVGDNGTIVHTVNSGRTWQVQPSGLAIQSPPAVARRADLNSVYVNPLDSGEAWVVGDRQFTVQGAPPAVWRWTILHTTDHGATWNPEPGSTASAEDLFDVWFNTPTKGWVVGKNTVLQFSAPDWTNLVPPPGQTYSAIYMSGVEGWIVGTGGTILHTTNQWGEGPPLTTQPSGTDAALLDVAFASGTTGGYIVGDGGTVLTSTDGSVWAPNASLFAPAFVLTSVAFADASYGWMGGAIPPGPVAPGWQVLRTINGGDWTATDVGVDMDRVIVSFDSVKCGGKQLAWGVGLKGAIVANFDIDETPPSPPAFVSAVGGPQSMSLSWTNPSDSDWKETRIYRLTTDTDVDPATATGAIYTGRATVYADTGLGSAATYYYRAYACDESGNWSRPDPIARIVGTTAATATPTPTVTPPPSELVPPMTISDAAASYFGTAVIHLTATDGPNPGASGVAHTYYQVDGGSQTSGTVITVDAIGPHFISFWSVDNSGNEEAHRTALFSIAAPTPTPAATVSVSNPVAPSTMRLNRTYTVYSTLKPRHTAGTSPVRIYKYRLVSRRWKAYGYWNAKASNYSTYSKCSVRARLGLKGKWRLRSYAVRDGDHAARWSSGYDYVTVK